jgi:hypothetical protein
MIKLGLAIITCMFIISCEQNVEDTDENQILTKNESKPINPKYSEQQILLLKEFNMSSNVLNRYRYFISSLNESMDKKEYQIYIDKNWENEQTMFRSYFDSIVDLSAYLIKYENENSLDQQTELLLDLEHQIINHYKKVDNSINWEKILNNSLPPRLRKE